MAVYAYIASSAGAAAPIRGTIAADSPRQARDQLRAQGLSIRELAEQRAGKGASLMSHYLASRQSSKVAGLFQEMTTLLSAGIPLLEALDTITRQHDGRFKQSIMLLRDHVAAGGSLAEAMAQQPALFDQLCLSIVEVGENAGTLDESLARLVEFKRRSATLKNRVASAMIYPCIVMGVGLAISVFLMTYVVPKLLGVLEQSGKPLPFATEVVKGMSDFLIGWWWALGLCVAALIGLFLAFVRSRRGRLIWHRFQLRVPLLGELIRKQGIARVAMVMATLLKSDVTFIRSVQIARKTVKNQVLADALEDCEKAVLAGRDIADALEQSDAFPPLVIQVFAVGQASGRLETMLEDLASDYDTQVELTSNRLTALLEPLMMIVLAVVVGFIAFATIMPILEAGNVL
ncbi:MAG: type II secretion system F family protein [Phycisphaeraceae bacterium]